MKSLVGKAFTDTPSPFMRWLNPMIVLVEQWHLEFEYMVNLKSFYMTISNTIDYFLQLKRVKELKPEQRS